MSRFWFIILAVVFTVVSTSYSWADGLRAIERTFCLQLEGPACAVPAVTKLVSLSDIRTVKDGVVRLYFWSAIEVSEDQNVVHVWTVSHRPRPWAERIHVAYSDKLRNLALEILGHVRDFLFTKYKADPSVHSVQGVVLPIQRSATFRTYSSVRAVPGTYQVEIRNMNGNVLPGGEVREITASK